MWGWPKSGGSSDSTNGGRPKPNYTAQCARCMRERLVSEMVLEQNERSALVGFLVCPEPFTVGGCFEGPYPKDNNKGAGSDKVGPLPNTFWS